MIVIIVIRPDKKRFVPDGMCLARGSATYQTRIARRITYLYLHMNRSTILQMAHIKVRFHFHNKYRLLSRWVEHQYIYSLFNTLPSALNNMFWAFFDKTIIPLALVGYEMIIALPVSQTIYHLLVSIKYFRLRAIGLDYTRDKFATDKTVEYLCDTFLNFQNYSCCEKVYEG